MTNTEKIFIRIKELLKQKGHSQKWLKDKCGFSSGTLPTWKSGKGEPTEESLNKVARTLGVTIEYLRGEPERLTPEQTYIIKDGLNQISALQDYLKTIADDPDFARREFYEVRKLSLPELPIDPE